VDCCDGFNFALFSRHAERVELLLFEDVTRATHLATFELEPPTTARATSGMRS
jgi:isoamylase